MLSNANGLNTMEINSSKVALLENEIMHTKNTVSEIKGDIRDIKESSKQVELAVIKLSSLAEQNQALLPKLEKLEAKIERNSLRLAQWAGGMSILMIIFGVIIRQIIVIG